MKERAGRLRSRLAEVAERGPRGRDDSLRARLEAIRWLAPTRTVVGLASSSFAGGLAEAGALLVLIRAAAALASGDDVVDLSFGPLSFEDVTLKRLLLAGAALAVVRLLCHVTSAFLVARASSSAMLRVERELMGAFVHASWALQSSERQGALQDLATTHIQNSARTTVFVSVALTAAINFSTMVVSALFLSFVSAALLGVGVVALYLIFRPLTRMSRHQARRFAEANSEYATGVSEAAGMTLESATFGVEDALLARVDGLAARASRRFFNVTLLTRSLSGFYQNVAIMAMVLVLWLLSDSDGSELSTLGAMVIILLRALNYSGAFQVAQHSINELLPFVQRVRIRIDAYSEARRTSGEAPMPPFHELCWDAVEFGYGDGPVLDGVSFSIAAGEAVGVVGPSGAGKSTLAQILLRLRVPDQGRFHLDGIDAEAIDLDAWHDKVAFVPQEPRMLPGSVRDNVAFFRPLTDEQVEAACRAAFIHDEIVTWADGYDTELGSGANPLSGGQRQRICIARALAGGPDLLVLDEPTSALDMRSEAAIQSTLAHLRGAVTLVIIAHRVPTLQLCDRVMVLEGGRLVAFEQPDDLARTNEFFAEAVRLSRV